MTPRQLEILQHALGLDQYGQDSSRRSGPGAGHRNHFCAGASDEPDCRALVALGFMQEHLKTASFPYYNCSVTDAGRKAIREHSPAPPKLTRSQKRYRAFLDADTGFDFKDFLLNEKRQCECE